MLRRFTAVSRPAAAVARQALKPQTRAFSKNVVLELDAGKVGNEIRKRGLTSAVANRDGGMDRDTIIRLLYSLGSRQEVERYLRIFTQSSKAAGKGGVLPEAKFAVLK